MLWDAIEGVEMSNNELGIDLINGIINEQSKNEESLESNNEEEFIHSIITNFINKNNKNHVRNVN